ncbi:MAG: MgtC/SapB family protein [Rhodothermales bacterium]
MLEDITLFKALGEALAIGLLIGVERYKSRSANQKASAGLRTFPAIALLGAVCALMEVPSFTVVTFGALLVLIGVGYWRESAKSLGLTTEIAALLTFWLGYLVGTYEALIISAAIVLTILLASKDVLHGFVKGKVSEIEFYDTLKFLAVVFVIFPLLPNRDIGPYEFFNPTEIWLLVILVSTISYSGYVLIRILGSKRGLQVNALVGGLVSTMAVTMSLAERARKAPEASRLFGITGVMANAVQFPRLLVLVWVVDRDLALFLAIPLMGAFVVGLVGAWALGHVRKVWEEAPPAEMLLENPYSFWPALKFALLFVVVFLFTKLTTIWLGEQGVYLVSAVAGLADVSAISLSVADMSHSGSVSLLAASVAILIAVSVNALMKWGVALVNGNRELAFWLGGGFLTMLTTGVLLAFAVSGF